MDNVRRTTVRGPHEGAGLTGLKIIFDTYGGVNKSIKEKVIWMTPEEIFLENEQLVWIVSSDHMLCTPVNGPHEDAGFAGREIIFETYAGCVQTHC